MQALQLVAQKRERIMLAEQQIELRHVQQQSPARPSLVRRWVTSVMPGGEAAPEQQVQGLRHEVGRHYQEAAPLLVSPCPKIAPHCGASSCGPPQDCCCRLQAAPASSLAPSCCAALALTQRQSHAGCRLLPWTPCAKRCMWRCWSCARSTRGPSPAGRSGATAATCWGTA